MHCQDGAWMRCQGNASVASATLADIRCQVVICVVRLTDGCQDGRCVVSHRRRGCQLLAAET